MHSRGGMGTTLRVAATAAALVCCSTASAHKLTVFAAVEGDAIRGEAVFRDGGAAKRVAVTILGPAGDTLGQTQTDENGVFRFQPRQRVDHRLVVDAGGGHAGEFTVTAAELPAKLAASPEPAPASSGKPDDKVAVPTPESARPAPASPQPTAWADGLSDQISQLRAEVARLRKESAEAHDRLRMRDVLGGVGFLLGLGGTAFYFLGLRKKQATGQTPRT